MSNWQRKQLKEVVTDWVRGSTPRSARHEYYSDIQEIPWARAGDINGGILTETERYLTSEGAETIKGWAPKGAVLLSVSGTIGKTAIAGVDLKLNQAVQSMKFNEAIVLAEYAYYYFQFYQSFLVKMANKVTIPNLTVNQLKSTYILFPCLEEQKYIICVMKRSEKLMQDQQGALLAVHEILYSIMYRQVESSLKTRDMDRLGTYLTVPPIAGLAAKKEGDRPNCNYIDRFQGPEWALADAGDYSMVQVAEDDQERYTLRRGDLLYRRNQTDKDESCLLVTKSLNHAVWGNTIFRIRIMEEKLRPEFLLIWLRFHTMYLGQNKKWEKRLIDASYIADIPVPRISVKEQDQFVEIVMRVLKIQHKLADIAQKRGEFYKSMLSSALTAKLSVRFRILHQLEDPEGNFILRHYHAENMRGADEVTIKGVIIDRRSQLIDHMSRFQKEILRAYMEAESPMPIHLTLQKIRERDQGVFRGYSMRDAITTVKILEGLGFLERTVPQKIEIDGTEITDSRGKPIVIQKYQASLSD